MSHGLLIKDGNGGVVLGPEDFTIRVIWRARVAAGGYTTSEMFLPAPDVEEGHRAVVSLRDEAYGVGYGMGAAYYGAVRKGSAPLAKCVNGGVVIYPINLADVGAVSYLRNFDVVVFGG